MIACTYPGRCDATTDHVSGRCPKHRPSPPWLVSRLVPARFDGGWELWLEAHTARGMERQRLLVTLRDVEIDAVGRALDDHRRRNGS